MMNLIVAAALTVAPGTVRAAVLRIPAAAASSTASGAAGALTASLPTALGAIQTGPSLISSPVPSLATPAVAPAPIITAAPSAARPLTAVALTPEGRAPRIRAATPAQGLRALTEAFKEPGAKQEDALPKKIDAFYDGSEPMVKPAVDWWEVGGRRYESTAQLVRAMPRLGKSREATYYYRHKNAVDSRERRFNAVAGGVSAGLVGVAGGALLWALGSVAAPLLEIAGGLTASAPPSLLLFSGFFGAVLGLVGLLAGIMEGGKPSSNEVAGRLHVDGKSLRFIFKGDEAGSKSRVVNLNAYAQARTPSAAPSPAPQTILKGALKGLGMGLAVAASLMIPFVQAVTIPLMGPGIGMDIGRRLSLRGHAVGGLLGGALGLLVPLSFFAALALGGAQNIALMAVWAGGLGLVGAVLGALLNNPIIRADAWAEVYAPKSQWWSSER